MYPDGVAVDDTDTNTVNPVAEPDLLIEKIVDAVDTAGGATGDGNGELDAVGDIIYYTIRVTNTGNQTINNVTITDPLTGVDVNIGSLAPDAVHEETAQYAITQDDLDSYGTVEVGNLMTGTIDNTATVDSDETDPETATEKVPLDLDPAINLTKEVVSLVGDVGGMVDEAGDQINYVITVTNTGNVALGDIIVNDTLTGELVLDPVDLVAMTGDLDNDGLLDVNETWLYYTTYTVTVDDIATFGLSAPDTDNAGFIDNTADVTGTAPDDQVVTDEDNADVPILAVDGWFGTPGFWHKWTSFYDGIEGNEPDQSGKDFFPDGEMTSTIELDDGTMVDDAIHIDLNGDGVATEDEVWTSEYLLEVMGSKGGGSNGVDKLERDMVALILNLAASPESQSDGRDGTTDPIQLLAWANAWLAEFGDDFISTNDDAWRDDMDHDGDGTIDPSAALLHTFIDDLNNYGRYDGTELYPGGTFGLDRDMEGTEDSDTLISTNDGFYGKDKKKGGPVVSEVLQSEKASDENVADLGSDFDQDLLAAFMDTQPVAANVIFADESGIMQILTEDDPGYQYWLDDVA